MDKYFVKHRPNFVRELATINFLWKTFQSEKYVKNNYFPLTFGRNVFAGKHFYQKEKVRMGDNRVSDCMKMNFNRKTKLK